MSVGNGKFPAYHVEVYASSVVGSEFTQDVFVVGVAMLVDAGVDVWLVEFYLRKQEEIFPYQEPFYRSLHVVGRKEHVSARVLHFDIVQYDCVGYFQVNIAYCQLYIVVVGEELYAFFCN